MKSASLFLSLIACGQAPHDTTSEPAPILTNADDTVSPSIVAIQLEAVPTNTLAPSPGLAPVEFIPPGQDEPATPDRPEGTPVLMCASSSTWNGLSPDLDPEAIDPEALYSVTRISIFEGDEGHTAVVETGSAQNPETILGTEVYEDVYFEMSEEYLDLTWEDSYITAWRTPSYGPVFNGGGWGDIATPIISTGEPPPPCGFEIYLSCWEPGNTQSPFQYDSKQGECVNKDRTVGLNYKPIEYIRETGDGECAELSWIGLSEGLPFDVELNDWNLRGAKLEYASLGAWTADDAQAPSHSLLNAKLDGADLTHLDTFNAVITGTTDAHTQLPDMDCITDDDGFVDCES